MIFSAAFILSGCADQNKEAASTVSENSSLAASETADNAAISAAPPLKRDGLALEKKLEIDYSLRDEWIKTQNAEIRYPIIEGFPGQLLQDYMNQSILSAVNGYANAAANDGEKVTLDYKVTRMDNEVLSLLITGSQPHEGGVYAVMFAVNLDLATSEELNAGNVFKQDNITQKALSGLLKQAKPEFSSEFGTWLGIYFEDSVLNFFYLENDASKEYTIIPVTLRQLQPYIEFNTTMPSS
jgi:hypothetical protein